MIDGETAIYATVGNPIAQIRIPRLMPSVFAAVGVNAVWIPLASGVEGLPVILEALKRIENFKGISVTVPHKSAVCALLDRVSPRVEAAGSANLVRVDKDGAFYGDMVDGIGCVSGLRRVGYMVAGKSAWIVGVGGAGSAVAAALCEAQIGKLLLTDIDRSRAEAAVARLHRFFPEIHVEIATAPPKSADFFINATPLGMRPGDPLSVDVDTIPKGAVVVEVIMRPAETRLLVEARARGYKIHHGRHMLDAQVALYLEFFGLPVPPESTLLDLVTRIPP